MATKYRCVECGKIYDQMRQDGFCSNSVCYGVGLLESFEDSDSESKFSNSVSADEIGLCVLVCDASGSMESHAFSENPASRIQLVANAAAAGISDYYRDATDKKAQIFSKPEQAYIAIVGFGETASIIQGNDGKPFIKTLDQIQQEFPQREDLSDFLHSSLTKLCPLNRKYTDITKALVLAKEIQDAALKGDLSAYGISGSFKVMEHDIVEKNSNNLLTVPNTRVLIYSDGGHNPGDGTSLSNPFESESLSTLMTVFLGNPDSTDLNERKGADEMKSLACLCPIHKIVGYYLIDSPQRYAKLRGIFRMASGASGFCPGCLAPPPKER